MSQIYDYLVIGAGLSGLASGAGLSDLGSVLILEAEEALSYHASGRSAAVFVAPYGSQGAKLLADESLEYFQAHDMTKSRGRLLLGLDDAAFAEDARHLMMDDISLDEAYERFPILRRDVISRTAYSEDTYDLDADLLAQALAREARAGCAEIVLKAPVDAIEWQDNLWQVQAGGQNYQARRIVNAAGAWVDKIAELAGLPPIGFKALRRSMARVPSPDGFEISDWPMVIAAGARWYCKPDAGALLVSPCEEGQVEPHDAYAEDMVLAEGLARFAEDADYEPQRLLANWAGLRTFAPDREMVIGRDPRHEQFFWVAGQGGTGVQTAPATRRLVAGLVRGDLPANEAAIFAALSPARFF